MGLTILDHNQTPVIHGRQRLSTGVRLHYYTAGTGPAVLLQHGIPKTSYYWRKVLPLLSPHYTCIVPDMRGIGDSTHPDSDYSMATVADDLAELMQKLGHEKYHVIGEDWGAAAGYQLASRYRERVLSLVFQEMLLPGFGLEEWVRLSAHVSSLLLCSRGQTNIAGLTNSPSLGYIQPLPTRNTPLARRLLQRARRP